MSMARKPTTTSQPAGKSIEALEREEARCKNIPTAEYQAVMQKSEQSPFDGEHFLLAPE